MLREHYLNVIVHSASQTLRIAKRGNILSQGGHRFMAASGIGGEEMGRERKCWFSIR